MKKTILSGFILAAVSICISCNKAEQTILCPGTQIAKVLKVEGPISVGINRELILNISFEGHNGCAGLCNFSESTKGNTTQISTMAKYEGSACTQAIVTVTAPYKFIKSSAGNYVLKFSQPDSSFITHNITVE